MVKRIEASGISAERGGRRVFSDLSFELCEGGCLLVTGPNGAGKSTLLRILAGLLPLWRGTLSWTPGSDAPLAEQTHYVGHADALKGTLTVAENLGFLAALLGTDDAGVSVAAALDALGLARLADLPTGCLSAGQKRRVALARLLVARRPLWLLDEPSTALDRAAQGLLGKIMAAHRAEGGMIVAATHASLGIDGRELKLGSSA
jgi:heme exporter protein A